MKDLKTEGGFRKDLVLSLGNPLFSSSSNLLSSPSNSSLDELNHAAQRQRALTDTSALSSVIHELVTSERSYVKRLQILKHDYADPLRNFARSKDTAIIPPYEAKTLFGNIDNLLPVNEAFLVDLERMLGGNGTKNVGGVGDVALRHFKDLKGFEQYRQYYVKREDAQLIFEKEVAKRSSRFAAYIDHIKYQSTDPKNRVGLRELLMEPVQRIPRYTLLFRTILKHMAPDDPQRAKVIEADEIASKIALAETDEQTKRAAVFYCLIATIDGFPPDLFSNSRRFIDCVDVEDILTEGPVSSSSSSNSAVTSLHCTLFLFDDKLVIVKRPGNGEKGGRSLSGLDSLDKVTKAGGIPTGKKKSGMSCKGVIDITDVVVTDIGGADINLYLENPPQDQTDRWSGRSFRSLSVVNPPMPVNLDPTQTEADKRRFLENLWNAQATYRSRSGQSVVLCSDEQEVESRSGRITRARTYYNVYQRSAFLQEPKKTKVLVHIDSLGSADPVPFGIGAPPFARIRVQPMAGGLCRYSVSSSDPRDESEEDIVQTERVPSRIVQTIHQFGLFEFKTGRSSLPGTPTARSKAAIFGLDAISRNLFNTRPGSSMGDFFGGSISGRRRTKSATSRSSTYAHTTTTEDSSMTKSSHRSNSTTTAATTISTMDDDSSFFASRSSKGKNFWNRAKSPSGTASDSDRGSPSRNLSRSRSHSISRSHPWQSDADYSDVEDERSTVLAQAKDVDSSDYNLAMQLELARQNSMNQHGKLVSSIPLDMPVEDTIYEEEPPQPVQSTSRAMGDATSHRSMTPRPASPVKLADSPPQTSRTDSRHSFERRPFGPRSPSPLPFPSPKVSPSTDLPSVDADNALEPSTPPRDPLATPSRYAGPSSAIPRSKRQLLFPAGNTEVTPKPATNGTVSTSNIEPLSIKKKAPGRISATSMGSPLPTRKFYARNSPLNRNSPHIVSPRRVSPQVRRPKPSAPTQGSYNSDRIKDMQQLAVSTKDDIDSSRRSIKRIKLEVDAFRFEPQNSRPVSPDKGLRMPQPSPAMTKAALERMEEMRNMIGRRQGESTPKGRPRSGTLDTIRPNDDELVRSVQIMALEADQGLARAMSNQDDLQTRLKEMAAELAERAADFEKSRLELQNAKRQCELVKSLLADATAEKEIMYEAFNEELDGMYNDANLPDDEAWQAMSRDLRQTKETRNALTRENSQLKRQLAEAELQREEWGDLLRSHGLIS